MRDDTSGSRIIERLYNPTPTSAPQPHVRCPNKTPTRPPNALERAKDNELRQTLAKPARQRKGHEDGIRHQIGDPPADDVRDAGKEDSAAEVGEGVGQGHPVDVVDLVEFLGDGVEAGGDDGGVQEGEEEAEADAVAGVSLRS